MSSHSLLTHNAMEHIIITKFNGYVRLTPELGYILRNVVTRSTHSEAVVKEQGAKNFEAIPKP